MLLMMSLKWELAQGVLFSVKVLLFTILILMELQLVTGLMLMSLALLLAVI